MRRLLPFLALAALLVAAAAVHAYKGHKVYVPQSGLSSHAFKPHDIVISGDSSYAVTKLRYSAYGGKVAKATGISEVDNCEPSCANGHVDKDKVRVQLTKPHKKCGRYFYGEIRLSWPGPKPKGFRRHDVRELGPYTCLKG